MTYYASVTVTPTDDSWVADYISNVTPLVHQHGGTYLARTQSHERLEGDTEPPALMVIIEWPTKAAAEAFYNDPAYAQYRDNRLAGSQSQFDLVEGIDDFA